MTSSRSAQQIVANVMGESSTSSTKFATFNRFNAIVVCTCACTLLQHKIFVLCIHLKRLLQLGTLIWLPSVFILDILVFAIVYAFLTAPYRWHLRTNAAAFVSKVFATLFAVFVVIVTCTSMVLLIETGHELKWKLAFEVEWSSTKSLFTPQIPLFSVILILQPILGVLLSLLIRYWQSTAKSDSLRGYLPLFNSATSSSRINLYYDRFATTRSKSALRWINRWKYILIGIFYLLLIITLRPQRPWNQFSRNPMGGLAWTLFHPPRHHHNRVNTPPPTWDQKFVNYVAEQLSAPAADLSKPPRAYLKHPIRNVVIVNLESIRADALPFSHKLLESIGSQLVDKNLTADEITPFWNSLMPQSLVMGDTSATSSYTLKTLLSSFCGMYPLNVNFMEEGRQDRHFYQECLPQLIRKTFPATHAGHRRWFPRSFGASRFKSAFFQSSENTFDHQEEEFNKMGWDKSFYAPDVRRFSPSAQDMGWFGVGDNDLLPLFFDWIDTSLGAKKQIIAGILTTSTHFPFPLPDGEEYVKYIKDDTVNKYLNSIRKTDEFLERLVGGFRARGVLEETMFVMIGDHGHAFDDWNHKILGALDNPMENGFRVPFMVYSPALLPAGPVEGKFTNLDILPTVMDALISSSQDPTWDEEYAPVLPKPATVNETSLEDEPVPEQDNPVNLTISTSEPENNATIDPSMGDFDKRAENNLMDLNRNNKQKHIQEILRQYEGTSIFRPPLNPSHPQRITFHLDNPGNAHIILVQYPFKLVHDAIGEQTYLYDLSHDIGEWDDLLSLPYSRGGAPPPPWVSWREEDLWREFHLNWWIAGTDEFGAGRTAPSRDDNIEHVKPFDETLEGGGEGKCNLKEALDWAEDAFEILLGWSWINRERYLTGKKDVDILRSTALESLRDDMKGGS